MSTFQNNPKSAREVSQPQIHRVDNATQRLRDRTLEELDLRLHNLAIEAKQHPPKNNARRKTLTQLICSIQQSGKLYSQEHYHVSIEVYNDALAEVFRQTCHNIETYNPAKGGIIDWVNFLLDKQLLNPAHR